MKLKILQQMEEHFKEDRAAAQRLVDGDPYKVNGVFESVEVRAWKWLLKDQ